MVAMKGKILGLLKTWNDEVLGNIWSEDDINKMLDSIIKQLPKDGIISADHRGAIDTIMGIAIKNNTKNTPNVTVEEYETGKYRFQHRHQVCVVYVISIMCPVS